MHHRVPCTRSRVTASLALEAGNALVAALLAPTCAVCSAVLDQPLSGCVCGRCWSSVRPITPPTCPKCGDPLARHALFSPGAPAPRCRRCRARSSPIDRASAVGEYDGVLREIIHALKYSGRLSLAPPLSAMMRLHGRDLLEHADFVVPVPLHWRREYRRGFNQANELARALGPRILQPLARRRHTRTQVELAAERRTANVAGAFALRGGWLRRSCNVRGYTLVLVDDVSTTGATLEACAEELKNAGAENVYALTVARVVAGRRAAARRR